MLLLFNLQAIAAQSASYRRGFLRKKDVFAPNTFLFESHFML